MLCSALGPDVMAVACCVQFKGEWKPKKISNPAYKGKWVAPDIDNPDFVDDPE